MHHGFVMTSEASPCELPTQAVEAAADEVARRRHELQLGPLLLLAVALFVGILVARSLGPAPEVCYLTEPVTVGEIAPYVTASGRVVSESELALRSEDPRFGEPHSGNSATFTLGHTTQPLYHGEVARVSRRHYSFSDQTVYEILITANAAPLPIGASADARITTNRYGNRLRVPEAALRYAPIADAPDGTPAGSSAHVWVLREGRPKAVTVTLGLQDEQQVEILGGGVKPGDAVIVAEQIHEEQRHFRGARTD